MSVVRMTDTPQRLLLGSITETGANTFTQSAPIRTPVVALQSGGKVIAMEAVKVVGTAGLPSVEAGQANQVNIQLTTESKSARAQAGVDSDVVMDRETGGVSVIGAAAATGGASITQADFEKELGEGGTGELITSGDLFIAIVGTGNAGARSWDGYLLYYPVEIDSQDFVIKAILTDD